MNNEEQKGKKIKIELYVASSLLLFLFLILFDYVFSKNIDWTGAIILTAIITAADLIGVKKYIENKSGEKFTKKQNINHFLITILVMIIALLGYYSIKQVYDVNKEPNNTVLEMSVKKSLLDIANSKYKNNEIYVYVVANYELFSKNENKLIPVNSNKGTLTMIYKKDKNKNGIYELKEKANVNYESSYFKNQLNNYNNFE